ncbi:MAG: hypothetical protein H6625_00985 [Bdellovibrionaceae bacterium]|nr:hypothetical protein [Pseudobdellovibrionaceae bacterium]
MYLKLNRRTFLLEAILNSTKSGKELSNKQLGLNHMAATVATLLRTPSPITSASSLIQLSGSNLIPLIEKTKIVS